MQDIHLKLKTGLTAEIPLQQFSSFSVRVEILAGHMVIRMKIHIFHPYLQPDVTM